jgi:hypothetical protein
MPDCEHNLCDMARTLRMGENAFRRPCNFKELRVVKRAHIATCALCACWQPLYRIGRTNIFHVTASNGIVSNWPYTPLAIMTASPIASVRVFDPRCRCRLATFAALPTTSMIEPIIMLTDHPLPAPHRQVRRCHRSIHCWHGHAARRSALPRERFSPMAHRVISLRCGIWSLPGQGGHWSSPHESSSIYEYVP